MRTYITLLLVLLITPLVSAQVLVFDEYTTTATIQDDHILIERTITMRNTGIAPIIPGELHFRFFEEQGGEQTPIPVRNVEATSAQGETLGTRILDRGDETDLSVQIWNPLLPGFNYQFSMSYEIEFEPRGILFHELTLPREETTVPILREDIQFVLKDNYHVTYAPESTVNKISGNTVIEWDEGSENRIIEYSRIPFPQIGIRGVNAFWLTLIVALLVILGINIRSPKQPPQNPPQQRQYNYQQYNQQNNNYQQYNQYERR